MWPNYGNLALCLLVAGTMALGGCTSTELQTWGEILDVLGEIDNTSMEAKKTCFNVEDQDLRLACERRYDRTFGTE